MYGRDRASQHLGIVVEEVGPGRAKARMLVTAEMINGHDMCHGGYLFLLADTAFAFACNTYSDVAVAAVCDIAFLRPVLVGEEVTAWAQERTRRGRSGIYDVTLRCEGEAVAEFRGHSRTLRAGA